MKYLVIDESKFDWFVEEFKTSKEAIDYADEMWRCKSDYDKKHCKAFYVLESENPDEDACNHFDGNPIKEYK